ATIASAAAEDWDDRQRLLDSWREVDGRVEQLRSVDWCEFSGTVEQHHSANTVRINGTFRDRATDNRFKGAFVVVNFPYSVADGDHVGRGQLLLAKQAGMFTYSSVLGGPRQLRKLDFGKPAWAPKPRDLTLQEKELARAAA